MYFGFVQYWWKFLTCIEIHEYACPHSPIKEQCCGYFHNSYLYAYTFRNVQVYKFERYYDKLQKKTKSISCMDMFIWSCQKDIQSFVYK